MITVVRSVGAPKLVTFKAYFNKYTNLFTLYTDEMSPKRIGFFEKEDKRFVSYVYPERVVNIIIPIKYVRLCDPVKRVFFDKAKGIKNEAHDP